MERSGLGRTTIRAEPGVVLIVTNREDISADLVVLELQRRNWPYARFNTEDFPSRARLSLRVPPETEYLNLKRRLELDSVRAVWYRRPVAPRPAGAPTEGSFGVLESQAAIENLWSRLDCTWISAPARIRAATPRLAQLRVAAALGLDVLPTLLTNDAEDARRFVNANWPVVVKPIGIGLVPEADRAKLVYTHVLEDREVDSCLASLDVAPVLLQRLAPKRVDLRVTVVRERIFATEIWTPPDAPIDWRSVGDTELKHVPHQLPPAIEQRILALVKHFGLAFGALDFVLTPDGRYVFLEINPNGQWAWIEQVLGTPIAAALVDALTAGQPAG